MHNQQNVHCNMGYNGCRKTVSVNGAFLVMTLFFKSFSQEIFRIYFLAFSLGAVGSTVVGSKCEGPRIKHGHYEDLENCFRGTLASVCYKLKPKHFCK